MMSDDFGEGHLDLEVQRLLGAALRAEYSELVTHIPERFVRLLIPLRDAMQRPRRRLPSDNDQPASPLFAQTSFDPETLAVLSESFDDGWDTLRRLGNTTITRDVLAKQLLDLARNGERNPARMCTSALVTLLARCPE